MSKAKVTRIARGSFYLGIQSIFNPVMSVIAFAFIARILTQTQMGVTVALVLVISVAETLSDLGFTNGLTKYIAEYRARNKDYRVVVFSGVMTKTLTTLFIAGLSVVAAQQISVMLLKTQEYTIFFQLLSVNLFFACVNTTTRGILIGLNKFWQCAVLGMLNNFLRQTFAVILLMCGYGLRGLILGWVVGESADAVLSILVFLKGKHLTLYSIKENVSFLKTLTEFSWPLFITNIVVLLYEWFDRAILLAYVPLTSLAVYNVAYTAFSILTIMPSALTTTLFPYFSEQHGRNRHENIAAGVTASTRYLTLIYTPLALGVAVIANPVITLFAGQLYASGDIILAILSLVGGFVVVGAATGPLLLVYNMTRIVLRVNAVVIGLGIALSLVLLPSLGVTGMAVVKGVTMIISFVFTVFALRKREQIRFDREALWKSWSAAILMCVVVWIIEQAYFSLYSLPIYILVGGIVYVLALRLLKAVKKRDIELVRTLVGSRLSFLASTLEKILT